MVYDKVVKYCEENNISICAFEKKCGIGNGTIGKWKEDVGNPSLETIQKIALATNTKVSIWVD